MATDHTPAEDGKKAATVFIYNAQNENTVHNGRGQPLHAQDRQHQ